MSTGRKTGVNRTIVLRVSMNMPTNTRNAAMSNSTTKGSDDRRDIAFDVNAEPQP